MWNRMRLWKQVAAVETAASRPLPDHANGCAGESGNDYALDLVGVVKREGLPELVMIRVVDCRLDLLA